ncbi:uncharacterized protein LOC135829685 [Sycon ciliatum]|uniref:uncharacterized protein LOC135829685 n=1 Tax=Sycon ciliatum TaxID=27933 RepID=UPI0031F62505
MANCDSTYVSLYEDGLDPMPDEQADRVVVIIGRTGAGKSAMANVLAGKENLFHESSAGMTEPSETPTELVAVHFGGTRYVLKIVDTIGIGDKKLKPVEVLNQLAHIASKCTGGINQVLFVIQSRFTKEEEDALRSAMFQGEVIQYTSIICTKCVEYEDPAEEIRLKKYLQEISPVMASVKKFLLVDNPPTTRKITRETAMDDRLQSRKRVLGHLIMNCKERYSPDTLQRIQERVKDKIDEETKLERLLEPTKKEQASLQKELASIQQTMDTQRQTMETQKPQINRQLKEMKDQAAQNMISADQFERQNKEYLGRLAAMEEAKRRAESEESQIKLLQEQLLTQKKQQIEVMKAQYHAQVQMLNARIQQLEQHRTQQEQLRTQQEQLLTQKKQQIEVMKAQHHAEVQMLNARSQQPESAKELETLKRARADL